MTNLIGHSLGRYHILEQLGQGGMATLPLVLLLFGARNTRDNRSTEPPQGQASLAVSSTGQTDRWGDAPPNCSLVNFYECVGDTTAVRSYPTGASPYGALDMAGNGWKWVNDRHHPDYYAQSPMQNPQRLESSDERVVRSGSWDNIRSNIRVTARRLPMQERDDLPGFRCAHTP